MSAPGLLLTPAVQAALNAAAVAQSASDNLLGLGGSPGVVPAGPPGPAFSEVHLAVLDEEGRVVAANVSETGANTGDVTLGTANGLSLVGQVLSLALVTTLVAGAMSAADKTKLDFGLFLQIDPILSSSYIAHYTAALVDLETWTDTASGKRVKDTAYTYSNGLVDTEVRKVYSTADGTTVLAQLSITYSYTLGVLASATQTRNV